MKKNNYATAFILAALCQICLLNGQKSDSVIWYTFCDRTL